MNRHPFFGLFALIAALMFQAVRPAPCAAQPAGAAAPARVGTLDVDKIAAAVGWTRDIQNNLNLVQAQMRDEVAKVQGQYEAQLQRKKAELGIKDTDTGEE